MNCANCSSAALYVYDPPALRATPYCERHLPTFLRAAAKNGSLTKAPEFDNARDRALSAMAPPQEPVDPPAQEQEDPKPTRRRKKTVAEKPQEETAAAEDAPEPEGS